MKRIGAISLLLVFILANFGFVILRLGARGSEDNFFNKNLRGKFAESPLARNVLDLHFDGDGKTDYLGTRYAKITIEIDQMAGLALPAQSLELLAEKMQAATGKEVSYIFSDSRIPYEMRLSRERIEELESRYRNLKNGSDTASVYLLYVSQSETNPDEVGSTYNEYGILLFHDVLKEFTKSNPDTLNNYLASTVLHEFGHQLGLPHNDFSDCLMQAFVDEGFYGYTSPESVIVDFCEYEKKLIRRNQGF